MISSQIQTLLAPPKHDVSVERAICVLDDNIKSLDDLEREDVLDRLLQETQLNSEQLSSQLAQSSLSINELLAKARSDADAHLTAAQELSLMRHSLADELASLSDALVSTAQDTADGDPMGPTLLEEIESLHRSLKELQSVKGYVEVVHRALELSEQAVQQFERSSSTASSVQQSSLTEYKSLQQLVSSVRSSCANIEGGEGSGLRLVSFLEGILRKTWVSMKDVLGTTLLATAEKLHWPLPVNYTAASAKDRAAFESAFRDMLVLQELGEKLNSDDSSQDPPEGLYPLHALVRPIALRFKYHFEGTRQTNRLDKPEWYFAHILNAAHDHHLFMESKVQQLIRASSYKHINAWREFVLLLLPIVTRKIRKTMPALLPHPPLLAHTVYQALTFDDALREAGFGLGGTTQEPKGDPAKEWEGIGEIILGQKDWFETWVLGERAFVENQYNEIISAPDAWHIFNDATEDASSDKTVRPTNSARRIKALLEQVTDRYRPLPRFGHKTRFLIDVQVPILELYHTRISESLDAFETLSSFLVRAVPGALAGQSGLGTDTKRMTTGVEGVQRLVKAFVSAKWMGGVMASWGEDVFFLELWHSICERSQLRKTAEKTPSLPNPSTAHADETIFEELIIQYKALADRAEGMIIRQIYGEVESELKNHLHKATSASEEGTGNDNIVAQTLLAPIACLSSHLTFLRKNLPASIATSIYRQAASHISTHILQRAIFFRGKGRLSMQDGKAILDETNLWIESCRLALGSTVRKPETPWKALLDSCKLLSLDSDMFRRAVNIVNLGNDSQFDQLKADLGLDDMNAETVLDVLRVRDDFMA